MAKGSERARLRAERRAELAALARLMEDPAGRRWARQMLAECHLWVTSGSTNALAMAFREGERFIGLRLQQELIQANEDMYAQMLKEVRVERPSRPSAFGGNYDTGDDTWSERDSDRDGDDDTGFAE